MKLRVAVVYGGRSGEHEISIRSAESIIKALDPEKYKVLHYFISKEGKWRPRPIVPEPGGNPEIDVVFPVLHGTFGEDGTVQGMFELAELPYVGAGVLASALAMDKEMTKRVCRASGISVVDYKIVYRDQIDIAAIEETLPYPMFVKPANLGSSVGISKAKNRAELEIGLSLATQFDNKVIVERGITGREFECFALSIRRKSQQGAGVDGDVNDHIPSRRPRGTDNLHQLRPSAIEVTGDQVWQVWRYFDLVRAVLDRARRFDRLNRGLR